MNGWMGGWMDGRESRVKDCLQQSIMKKSENLNKWKKIPYQLGGERGKKKLERESSNRNCERE
jgi:hypothetical protein